jgi:hypothetical protein
MSTEITDGGPAFPSDNFGQPSHAGMTLRDYFAAKALDALISLPQTKGTETEFAKWAYAYADAMLAARKEASK